MTPKWIQFKGKLLTWSALEHAMQPLKEVLNIVGVFFDDLWSVLLLIFAPTLFLLPTSRHTFLQIPIMLAINRSQCEHGVNNSRIESEVFLHESNSREQLCFQIQPRLSFFGPFQKFKKFKTNNKS